VTLNFNRHILQMWFTFLGSPPLNLKSWVRPQNNTNLTALQVAHAQFTPLRQQTMRLHLSYRT